jgi:hypothetical protein
LSSSCVIEHGQVQLQQACLEAEAGTRVLERRFEQQFGGRRARVRRVHRRGRDAQHARRSVVRFVRARQRMRWVRQLVARRRGLAVHQHAAVLDLDVVPRHAVGLVAGLALAGRAVELPIVPRADHVVAVERAVAERAADVVAGTRDRAELAITAGERDRPVAYVQLLQRLPAQFVGAADIDPLGVVHVATTTTAARGNKRGRTRCPASGGAAPLQSRHRVLLLSRPSGARCTSSTALASSR